MIVFCCLYLLLCIVMIILLMRLFCGCGCSVSNCVVVCVFGELLGLMYGNCIVFGCDFYWFLLNCMRNGLMGGVLVWVWLLLLSIVVVVRYLVGVYEVWNVY